MMYLSRAPETKQTKTAAEAAAAAAKQQHHRRLTASRKLLSPCKVPEPLLIDRKRFARMEARSHRDTDALAQTSSWQMNHNGKKQRVRTHTRTHGTTESTNFLVADEPQRGKETRSHAHTHARTHARTHAPLLLKPLLAKVVVPSTENASRGV